MLIFLYSIPISSTYRSLKKASDEKSEKKCVKDFVLYFDQYFFRYIGYTQKLALLLDYDGTLAPIAPHPDLATLPLETKHTLQRLSNMSDVYIAIISGRNVDNVKNMVSYPLTSKEPSHIWRPRPYSLRGINWHCC